MEEAEYCDRVVIMDAGRVLALGTPAGIRSRARAESGRAAAMEEAFIAAAIASRCWTSRSRRWPSYSETVKLGHGPLFRGRFARRRMSPDLRSTPKKAGYRPELTTTRSQRDDSRRYQPLE
jgi:ABC-type multidrug transport system ATPase subunit